MASHLPLPGATWFPAQPSAEWRAWSSPPPSSAQERPRAPRQHRRCVRCRPHTPGHLSSHLRALGGSPMTAHPVMAPSLLVLFLWCPQAGQGTHHICMSPWPPLGSSAHLPLHRPCRHCPPSIQPAPMRPHASGHLCPLLAALKLLPPPLPCHRPPRPPSVHDRASQPLTHGHSGARRLEPPSRVARCLPWRLGPFWGLMD